MRLKIETIVNASSEVGLHDILRAEDDAAILDFKCPESGYLLWPLARIQFLRFILSDLLYGTTLINMSGRTHRQAALTTLTRALVHNAVHSRRLTAPIMLMGTGLGHYRRDGLWFNRLADYFVAACPASVTLEDFFEWRWPFPRHNQRVLFHAPIQVAGQLVGRLRMTRRHVELATELVGLVRARAKLYLDWDLGEARADYLIGALARHAAAIPLKRRAYQNLLSRTGVRLLLKEEGCYGPSSIVLAVAREMGIKSAEYQHGSVSSGNDAYNLSPILRNSPEYRKTLPDFFLGYGKWWNDQINVPVGKIVIGNPHRSEQVQGLAVPSDAQTDILLLGDGVDTERYLDFARELATSLGNRFRVVFRPHPLEREWVATNLPDWRAGSVWLDVNPDIYQSFLSAYAVVSEVSTGLFEAIGCAGRVFIWDTPKSRFCYPSHPFEAVASIEQLVARIEQPYMESSAVDPEDIWASGWRANYLRFLESTGIG